MADQQLAAGSRIEHPKFGRGMIVDTDADYYYVWFKSDNTARGIARDYAGMTVLEKIAAEAPSITLDDIRRAVADVIDEKNPIQELVPLGARWNRGVVIIKPEDSSLQSKEIPIDGFFHKIVMLRDRLRVMEQYINAHKVLTDEQKVDLQQYITRIYGSLTTFNFLFKNTEDNFRGTGGDK